MDEKTKKFLSLLKQIYESSQEATLDLIEMYGTGNKDPLHHKIYARREVIEDVLETLKFVGMLTEKEAVEQAELFDVEIDVEN